MLTYPAQDKEGDSPKKRPLRRREGTGWGKAVVALEEKMAGESGTLSGSKSTEAKDSPARTGVDRERERDRLRSKRSGSGGDREEGEEETGKKESRPTRRPLIKAKTAEHKRVK